MLAVTYIQTPWLALKYRRSLFSLLSRLFVVLLLLQCFFVLFDLNHILLCARPALVSMASENRNPRSFVLFVLVLVTRITIGGRFPPAESIFQQRTRGILVVNIMETQTRFVEEEAARVVLAGKDVDVIFSVFAAIGTCVLLPRTVLAQPIVIGRWCFGQSSTGNVENSLARTVANQEFSRNVLVVGAHQTSLGFLAFGTNPCHVFLVFLIVLRFVFGRSRFLSLLPFVVLF